MAMLTHGHIMFIPVDFSNYSDHIDIYKAVCKFLKISDEEFFN